MIVCKLFLFFQKQKEGENPPSFYFLYVRSVSGLLFFRNGYMVTEEYAYKMKILWRFCEKSFAWLFYRIKIIIIFLFHLCFASLGSVCVLQKSSDRTAFLHTLFYLQRNMLFI